MVPSEDIIDRSRGSTILSGDVDEETRYSTFLSRIRGRFDSLDRSNAHLPRPTARWSVKTAIIFWTQITILPGLLLRQATALTNFGTLPDEAGTRHAAGTSQRYHEATRHNHTTVTVSRRTLPRCKKQSKCTVIADQFIPNNLAHALETELLRFL
jgi:hypothetical protein